MPGIKRARTHADDFKDFEDTAPLDHDPEDEPQSADSEDDGSDMDDEPQDGAAARQHYEPVGKSNLRRLRDPAALGPQYAGSKISRNRMNIENDEHDPLAEYVSDEDSDIAEDIEANQDSVDDGSSGNSQQDSDGDIEPSEDNYDDDAATDNTSMSDDMDDELSSRPNRSKNRSQDTDRAELRRLLQQQNNVAASIGAATQLDAEKGRAVKRQRQTFDALLNTRIRMQQAVTVFNQFPSSSFRDTSNASNQDTVAAAETAALTLWNNLESLRQTLDNGKDTKLPITIDSSTPTSKIWTHMQSREAAAKRTRDSTLNKWSRKTTATAATTIQQATTSRRLQPSTTSSTADPLSSILASHLSATNMPALLARTRLATTNHSSSEPQQQQQQQQHKHNAATYDDSDFYAHLLQDLLSQRQSADLSAPAPTPSPHLQSTPTSTETMRAAYAAAKAATKARKNVDTKASKGRKLRYTVHEKLLNFMAPEDRGSWGDRQRDELFGSLLGKNFANGDEVVDVDDDEVGEEEGALMLFRN